MSFFTDDEVKKYVKDFFNWTDGKAYRFNIGKRIDTNFADGKETVILTFRDLDTADCFEMKYQFSLMNALHKLGSSYKDGKTPIEVVAHYGGKNSKNYDIWNFDVRVMEQSEVPQQPPDAVNQETKVEDIPFN
jgi:hypothetical protein